MYWLLTEVRALGHRRVWNESMVWGGVWRGFGELGCSHDEIVHRLPSVASQPPERFARRVGVSRTPARGRARPEAVGLISRLLPTSCLCSAMPFFASGSRCRSRGRLKKARGWGRRLTGTVARCVMRSRRAGGSSHGADEPRGAACESAGGFGDAGWSRTNSVPSFITASGPVRVARFVRKGDGSADRSADGCA
jgi:hypothetical protein